MAATPQPQPATGGGLSQKFMSAAKWVGHHLFSPTMIFMMVAMALPGVAAAATAVSAKATLGDIVLAVLDHYKTMFIAPFTEASTLGDVFNNTLNGNFAASSYELGAHGAHGAAGAAHGAAGAAAGASHAAAGHAAPACAPLSSIPAENLEAITGAAQGSGVSLGEYYVDNYCGRH